MEGVPQFYSLDTAANEIHVSVDALRKAIRSKELVAHWMDGRYLVTTDDLNSFIAGRRGKLATTGRRKK